MTSSIAEQRRRALRARRRLAPRIARRASARACRRIARLPEFRRARRIGLYWPMASETSPLDLLSVRPRHADVYLPRVAGSELQFLRVDTPNFARRRSALGVVEPVGGLAHSVILLDLLIVPLAGFDRHANRIGLGGGFYDRALAACRADGFRGPRLIGLAFETQRLERIEPNSWDVALDAIVTEAGVYRHATAVAGAG